MNRLEIMKRRILLLVLAAVFVLPAVARTPLQQRLDAFAHHLVDRDLEQLFEHHLRELMLPQARFQRVGNIGRKDGLEN